MLTFKRGLMILVVLSVFILAVPLQAATISTIMASDNGGDNGGAVYFDLLVGSSDILVTSLTTNLYSDQVGTSFTVSIYTTAAGTSYSGNESNSALWTLVATGSGVSAAENSPSLITLGNTFTLGAGTLQGVALVLGETVGHEYTNGDGTNQVYSNSDVTLTFGSATNSPFDSEEVFTPRVWNGSITYSTDSAVPEPATFVTLAAGLGLLGLLRRRRA